MNVSKLLLLPASRCLSKLDCFLVVLLSFIVYFNSLYCDFVFDDASAITDNKDLRPSVPLLELFSNDFWGTPMHQERSHKSYRPLTVLSFRLNYMAHGLNPFGYHLANVLLHCFVCLLFFRFCQQFLTRNGSFISSLHFALHPIHTEAVTGVVGRAELLSAMVFISIILLFEYVNFLNGISYMLGVVGVCLLLAGGTLCKEQCITVVGLLTYMELFRAYRALCSLRSHTHQHMNLKGFFDQKIINGSFKARFKRIFRTIWFCCKIIWRNCRLLSIFILLVDSMLILYLRGAVMDWKLPHFTEFDNPAAYSSTLPRRLTHLFLIPFNIWLLLYPSGLCADWTLGSIPLITEWTDFRNVYTVMGFGSLLFILLISLHPNTDHASSMTLSVAFCLLIFPFLPASNLFFPVGFVVAERVLYICSLGFSLLFGLGYDHFRDYWLTKWTSLGLKSQKKFNWFRFIPNVFVLIVFISFGLKTVARNADWSNEYSLFSSALKVNPTNAKMWNNVGHSLEAHGDFSGALGYFRTAVRVQPNDIGARINVGRTLVNMNLLDKAEEAYLNALEYFPKPKKGLTYYTRVAPKDLMVFINLANLYLNKTPPELDNAARLLQRAISLRSDFVDAYQNYGSVLIKQAKFFEAENAYRTAIKLQNQNPDLVYNLGVVLVETGRTSEGIECFTRALQLKPDHQPSMFALASALTDSSDDIKRRQGKKLFKNLIGTGFELPKVYFALGMLETDDKNFALAADYYRQVIRLEPNHRSALFNLALLLRNQIKAIEESRDILERLLKVHPDHVKSYLLLGDILLTEQRLPHLAKQLFQEASRLAPNNVQAKHNLCVALAEEDNLVESEQCLQQAIALSPNELYIQEHLKVVRKKLYGNS